MRPSRRLGRTEDDPVGASVQVRCPATGSLRRAVNPGLPQELTPITLAELHAGPDEPDLWVW